MALLTTTRHPTGQRVSRTIGSTVDGDEHIGLRVFNYDSACSGKIETNLAALVLTPTRTVEIHQTDGQLAHMLICPIQGKAEASLDMRA